MFIDPQSRLRHRHGSNWEATREERIDDGGGRKQTLKPSSFAAKSCCYSFFFAKNRRWRAVLLLIVSYQIIARWALLPLTIKYVGDHDMVGGEWGAKVDRQNRRIHRQAIESRRRSRLQELGIIVPPLDDARNEKYLTVTSEILTKRAERKRRLHEAEKFVNRRQKGCVSSTSKDDDVMPIPQQILQANNGSWFRPRQGASMPIIPFQEHDMRLLVADTCPGLAIFFEKNTVEEGKLLLWSLCALYKYGGYIFGRYESRVGALIDEVALESHGLCDDIAVVKFIKGADYRLQLLMLAASPRHPQVKCAIDKLEATGNTTKIEHIIESFFSTEAWKSSTTLLAVEIEDMPTTNDLICSQCSSLQALSCCESTKLHSCNKGGEGVATTTVQIVRHDDSRASEDIDVTLSTRTEVVIQDDLTAPAPIKCPKVSIRNVMKQSNCNASWRCHRCLNNPVEGTYETCSSVCHECFTDLICGESIQPRTREVVFNIQVHERHTLRSGEQRIPRIVHQTWFEDLSVEGYPQLTRVQSSWKNAGWEYRFYTDLEARTYIDKHFPSRFTDAYDSLLPGAFKADFFRALVLLKDGGVYADVDVLLAANLDVFITPTMSFFAPLDLVGADHDEAFCLWNGLIGTVPGHPILVETVEWLVNMILNRADAYDFERELCRYGGKTTPIWKLRQARILLLSGPCALGVAANRARGKANPVERIEVGWLDGSGVRHDLDDSLVLQGDKFDMNAFRFTDVARNMIVASTDMIDLTTTPLSAPRSLRKRVHYSETQDLDDVFGSKGIYVDNMVTNDEVIRLNVSYISC